MKLTTLAFLFSVLTLGAVHADECPVEFGNDDYLEKVAELATNANSCWEAKNVVSVCAIGASGDVYTVGAAIERCEKDIPAMSKKDQETKSYLHEKCNAKYADMEGTMYRSMNAFCHLDVSELFVNLLSKEE